MSERYDVAARLEEGRPAVEHTRTYVQACQALGYEQPDLTAHPSQVQDWYESEAGLDLRVLDSDAAELRVALTAVEEALWVQRTQVTEIATAWRGFGADSATQFLRRHCDTAAQVAGHVRAAAERCAALRDELWQTVDGKVATAVAIDERRVADRPAWLAAAHTVTAGPGERPAAEAVIRQQVLPFVDNDIRNDWLVAMSAASASVAAAYDSAVHVLAATADVGFDIPGDLGPSWQPAPEEHPVAATTPVMSLPAASASTVPAAAPAASPLTPDVPQSVPPDAAEDTGPEMPEAATPLGDASGLSSGAGGLGGLGGMAGGVGGILGSFVDSIGGLLGALGGGPGGTGLDDDPLGLDDEDLLPDDDHPDDNHPDDDLLDDDLPDDAAGAAGPLGDDVAPAATGSPSAENPPATTDAVEAPVGAPVANALPPDALPPGGSPADQHPTAGTPAGGSAPCEIAEDQLPQAGQ
ncbi:hypothetical protein [Mycobacterium sp.]|uniref:hypothetical protein n=1 Tax=Mycobacterium sp. TaxID=1785 RepID=UPI0025EE1665|nr:hypothetical protein [Mycobacterium sp.]